MTTSPLESFAEAYTSATGWHADPGRAQQDVRCPAHDDSTASLSVGTNADGAVLLTCQAGCEFDAVLDAVGLAVAELFPPRDRQDKPRIVASYPYTDEQGELLFTVHRFEPGKNGARKEFRQRAASGAWKTTAITRKPLYRLPAVVEAVKNGDTVWVVEGEKDADRLAGRGLAATTCPQGAGKWKPWHTLSLTGAADVRIVSDDDDPGRKHAGNVAAALRPVAAKVSVWLPASGKDVSDHLTAGHDLDELRPLDDGQPAEAEATVEPREARGPSQASQIVALAAERFEVFVSDDARPYGVKRSGPNVALPLRGNRTGLRAQLAKIYADVNGGSVPSQSALADAMTVLEGRAADRDPRPVHLRLAPHDDGVVVDLGTADGRCVVVEPGAWHREARSPVLFRRTNLTSPMPDPVRDGDGLAKLRGLLNTSDEAFRLLVAWLVAAWIPEIPHPVLAFRGEQGTGKSSAARVVVGVVDPSPAPLRSGPRDVKQWAVTASASWAVCLDNVSEIKPWLSDTLCKAVTGDGIVDRALYTDDDVTVLSFRRVIVLTSIDAGSFAGDLAERLLLVDLEPVDKGNRRTEAELNAAYADALPAIFASLLDLLSKVLATLPTLKIGPLPRMADFARVLAAVDKVMEAEEWKTLETYLAAAKDVSSEALEGDPFGTAVAAMVRATATPDEPWAGSASDLLTKVPTPEKLPKCWPKDATRASGHLRRIAPLLRSGGITVTDVRTSGKRSFVLGIEKSDELASSASSASSASRTRADLGQRDDASDDARPSAASASVIDYPPDDADDASDDADGALASSHHIGADLGRHHGHDASDADDAVVTPISGRIPPGEQGQCQKCRRTTHRYGDGGNPLCPRCRVAS